MSYDIAELVTSDVVSDQRILKRAASLSAHFKTVVIGRDLGRTMAGKPFGVVQLPLKHRKGPRFYWEYNWAAYRWLKAHGARIVVANDPDTLMAALLYQRASGAQIVYDAHELFDQVPELLGRPLKQKIWRSLEQIGVQRSALVYSVNRVIAERLSDRHQRPFKVLRNVPLQGPAPQAQKERGLLLYQGALNAGRCIDMYIDAMEDLPECRLLIAGTGDLDAELKQRVERLGLNDRVQFLGRYDLEELKEKSAHAWLGLNVLEGESLSYRLSLANKFFDYAHNGIPSLNSAFPSYEQHLQSIACGFTLSSSTKADFVRKVQQILADEAQYNRALERCNEARLAWHWEQEVQEFVADVHRLLA